MFSDKENLFLPATSQGTRLRRVYRCRVARRIRGCLSLRRPTSRAIDERPRPPPTAARPLQGSACSLTAPFGPVSLLWTLRWFLFQKPTQLFDLVPQIVGFFAGLLVLLFEAFVFLF